MRARPESLLPGAALALVLLAACGGASQEAPPPAEMMPDPLADTEARELFDAGVRLEQGGDMIRAEQYFVAAVGRGYPEAEVVPHLVRVCIASSRLNSALSHAEPYLRAHPEDWSLRLVVANIRAGLGDYAQARIELERVIRDRPQEAMAHYTLGVLLRDDLDAPEEAWPHFERYLELAPEGHHAAEVRAALVERAGPTPLHAGSVGDTTTGPTPLHGGPP